ncbi:MAG: adenosine kinase [Pseudomonadota bacterium]
MKQYGIYGLGAALVDTEIAATDEQINALGIKKGLMTLVDDARQAEILNAFSDTQHTFKRSGGGSAANSIIAASYFGTPCHFTGKVADDTDGHFYLKELAQAGVDSLSAHQLTDGTTGKCLVLTTPDAERSMNTYLGASETLSADLLNLSAIEHTQCVYIEGYLVTSPTGKECAKTMIQHAQKSGTLIAVSLSDPGIVAGFKDELTDMFGDKVDIVFCNEQEALSWTDSNTIEDAERVLKNYTGHYAITLGANGVIAWDGEQRHHAASPSVSAIDTNGAGDMFAGAYLHATLNKMGLQKSAEFACFAASKVVTQFGPRLTQQQYSALIDQLA